MNHNERLRQALDNEPVPRDLEARVRTRLNSRQTSQWARLASSLALLVVVAGGLEFFALQKNSTLLEVGVADHIHCAIAGEYPRQSDKPAMIQALGPYSPMLQPVLDKAPGDAVISAHRCTIGGRDYVHMILRRQGTMISVILTRRKQGESFPRGVSHQGELSGYAAAGFNAGSYLGYVISGLPASQNRELADKIAPVIRSYTGA
jgi:hypothetical protein